MSRDKKKDATAFKNWLKEEKKRKGATVRGKVNKGIPCHYMSHGKSAPKTYYNPTEVQ